MRQKDNLNILPILEKSNTFLEFHFSILLIPSAFLGHSVLFLCLSHKMLSIKFTITLEEQTIIFLMEFGKSRENHPKVTLADFRMHKD